MPYVLHTVLGFHHGPQAHHLHHILLFAALHFAQQLVEVAAHVVLGARSAQLITELAHEVGQVHQLLGVGCVVYSIYKYLGLLPLGHLAYALCHGSVGQQHELLNQLVGIFGHLEEDARRLALLVYLEAYLASVKVYRASGKAPAPQFLGHAVEHDELLGKVLGRLCIGRKRLVVVAGAVVVLLAGLVMCLQYLLHLLVGEASVAAYDGVCQVPVLYLGLLVERKDDAVSQLVLVGTQRADVVAEPLGQHGNGAIDQIHAGGALECFAVDDGSFGHVVAHVGDVYAHLPQSAVERTDAQRVVEVLGITRVNGEGHHLTHVLTLGQLLCTDARKQLVGSLLYGCGVLVGQSVLCQDGVHLGIVLARLAQDIDDMAHGVLCVLGPFGYLHHGLVAVLALLER